MPLGCFLKKTHILDFRNGKSVQHWVRMFWKPEYAALGWWLKRKAAVSSSPPQGMKWLFPVCSDGPESCPLSLSHTDLAGPWGPLVSAHSQWRGPRAACGYRGFGFLQRARERLGAQHRWRPWAALTQAELRHVSESFQADSKLKRNKINKRRLGEEVCLGFILQWPRPFYVYFKGQTAKVLGVTGQGDPLISGPVSRSCMGHSSQLILGIGRRGGNTRGACWQLSFLHGRASLFLTFLLISLFAGVFLLRCLLRRTV